MWGLGRVHILPRYITLGHLISDQVRRVQGVRALVRAHSEFQFQITKYCAILISNPTFLSISHVNLWLLLPTYVTPSLLTNKEQHDIRVCLGECKPNRVSVSNLSAWCRNFVLRSANSVVLWLSIHLYQQTGSGF